MERPAGALTKNWPLKLAALGLAVVLWTAVRIGAVSRQDLPDVPVRIQLNDPEWSTADAPVPSQITVGFTGPARHLFSVAIDRPTIVIPIDQVSGPDTTVVLRAEWVRLQNRQVVVEEFQPSTVRLSFEPFQQVPIPLSYRLEGELPDSLALAGPVAVNPLFTQAQGPASAVRDLETAFLEPLDLSGITASGRYTVALDTAGLSGVTVNPRVATLSVELGPRIVRVLPSVAVGFAVGGAIEGLDADPDSVDVLISGVAERVANIRPEDLRVEVLVGDVGWLEPGEERRARARVVGLPELVEGMLVQDSILVRRSEEH